MIILNTNFNEKQMKLNRMISLLALIAVVGCTNKQQETPLEETTLSGLKVTFSRWWRQQTCIC